MLTIQMSLLSPECFSIIFWIKAQIHLRIREWGSHCLWWAHNPDAASRTVPRDPGSLVIDQACKDTLVRPDRDRRPDRFLVSRRNCPCCTRRRRRSRWHRESALLVAPPSRWLYERNPMSPGSRRRLSRARARASWGMSFRDAYVSGTDDRRLLMVDPRWFCHPGLPFCASILCLSLSFSRSLALKISLPWIFPTCRYRVTGWLVFWSVVSDYSSASVDNYRHSIRYQMEIVSSRVKMHM